VEVLDVLALEIVPKGGTPGAEGVPALTGIEVLRE
jgi:hypothetical protein